MNIQRLNKEILKFVEEALFTDLNIEGLYNTIVPQTKGSVTFEEMQKIKDYLAIDENTNPELLRAIRNQIVKYWSDNSPKYREEAQQNLLNGDKDSAWTNYDRFEDQMSAFTGTIDYLLHSKNESLKEDIDINDRNLTYEWAWKLQDRNIQFIDKIIKRLEEMKENNELSGLGSYFTGLAHTFDSVDDIITDYNDDLDNLQTYIDYESKEDVKQVIGWLESYLSRYDGILREMSK